MIGTRRAGRWVGRLAWCVAVVAGGGRAEAQGELTGRVARSGVGVLTGIHVQVVGTNLIALTDGQGRYSLAGVPSGTVSVRASGVGFVPQEKEATVRDGEATTVDFELSVQVLRPASDGVVLPSASSGLGRMSGYTADTVVVDALSRMGRVRNLNDALTARVPGVDVVSGVQTGAGMRIRIRGTNSLMLSNEPIYVIDGIRMVSADGAVAFTPETGGSRPSRTGDLSVDEIQSVEILKGPSASTLYGGDAANGVVLIRTKRGTADGLRWTAFGEAGRIVDRATYPTAYTAEGHAFNNPATRIGNGACTLSNVASSSPARCVIDSVRSYNLFADPQATPLGTSTRYDAGLQLSGDTRWFRYFLSGSRQHETNPLTLPEFERVRLSAGGGSVSDEVEDPNALTRNSVRGNADIALGRTLDVALSAGYLSLDNRFAAEGSNGLGIASAFLGPGFPDNGNSLQGHPLHGYGLFAPGEIFAQFFGQSVHRRLMSAAVRWEPLPWLANRASLGEDHVRSEDLAHAPLILTPAYRDESHSTLRTRSADVSSTATFGWPGIESRTTVGAEYVGSGRNFDRTTVGPATTIESRYIEVKDTRVFIDEEMALRDQLVLSAGLGSESWNSLGTSSTRQVQPRFGLAWTLPSGNPVLALPGLDVLRLRAAYGVSAVPVRWDGPLVGPAIQPERTSEIEWGFDARLLNDRASLAFTAYRKRTQDMVVPIISAPPVPMRLENGGSLRNTGIEVSLDAQLLHRRRIGVDVAIGAATNKNELTSLGGAVPIVGPTTRAVERSPLFGYWDRPLLGYQDSNGDGIITVGEITVGDTPVFLGPSQPTRTLTIEPGLDLFDKVARITALFDHRGGHYLLNTTESLRCAFGSSCAGRQSPGASLFEQARATALVDHPARSRAGYVESAAFTRWRELAVTINLPDRLANRFLRARSSSISFAGRNLHLWTGYSGVDPEADSFASSVATGNGLPQEAFSLSVPTYYSLRMNLVF